jgi:hypothetical protein
LPRSGDFFESGAISPHHNIESLNNEIEGLELKKWILTAIEERVRKNNVFIVGRMVKKAAKKA